MDCIRIVTTEHDFTMIEIVTEKKILDFLVNAKKNMDSFLKLANTAQPRARSDNSYGGF